MQKHRIDTPRRDSQPQDLRSRSWRGSFGGAAGFLWEFMRSPSTVGAVAPSSRHLAGQIVVQSGVADAAVILEFGPGTGSFTRLILRDKRPDADFIAIEHNQMLSQALRSRFPAATIVTDSVERVAAIMAKHGLEAADCIVSGLPWAVFSQDLQDRLLTATIDALRPGGRFVTFAYLQGLLSPAGKRFRKKIDQAFDSVTVSPVVWRNLPPAVVYCCIK